MQKFSQYCLTSSQRQTGDVLDVMRIDGRYASFFGNGSKHSEDEKRLNLFRRKDSDDQIMFCIDLNRFCSALISRLDWVWRSNERQTEEMHGVRGATVELRSSVASDECRGGGKWGRNSQFAEKNPRPTETFVGVRFSRPLPSGDASSLAIPCGFSSGLSLRSGAGRSRKGLGGRDRDHLLCAAGLSLYNL